MIKILSFLKFLKSKSNNISVSYNTGILIVNNVTTQEFKKKLEEFRQKYDEKTAWSKITVLYDCKFKSVDKSDLKELFDGLNVSL